MNEIVLDDTQAEILACSSGEVAVRDRRGRLLEACPDHHWRAIVAQARYGSQR